MPGFIAGWSGYHAQVDSRRLVKRMRYGILVILVAAMAMCVWAAVLAVSQIGGSSLPGVAAVVVIAALGFAAAAWRFAYSWKRLHDSP
jgi:F0F1-type ATP synthase assembly protein I